MAFWSLKKKQNSSCWRVYFLLQVRGVNPRRRLWARTRWGFMVLLIQKYGRCSQSVVREARAAWVQVPRGVEKGNRVGLNRNHTTKKKERKKVLWWRLKRRGPDRRGFAWLCSIQVSFPTRSLPDWLLFFQPELLFHQSSPPFCPPHPQLALFFLTPPFFF